MPETVSTMPPDAPRKARGGPYSPIPAVYAFAGPFAYLSNFWLVSVELDGIPYPSVEHAYQAAKSTDPEAREGIRTARSPSLAKQLGRRLTLRSDWNAVRLQIMADLLEQKFRKPSLRLALLQTGDAELAEGNRWHDCYYGRCYCDRCGGKGHNHLGRLLMALRAQLRGDPA